MKIYRHHLLQKHINFAIFILRLRSFIKIFPF